jgi:Ca2+-binding RTX toxin-like protein
VRPTVTCPPLSSHRWTGDGGDDVVRGGAANDAPIVGDHDPVCGIPTGESGDDQLFGDAGDDQLHGDNNTDTGDPVVDSGDGNDACEGNAGTDTAALCESVTGVPSAAFAIGRR